MANSIQFFSPVENGHITDGCRQAIAKALQSLNGKFAKITIEERKKKRSLNQNNFYWGCVVPAIVNMFNEAGNNVDSDQAHEFLKAEVGKLNQKIIMPDGEIMTVSGSTASLTTMEFEDYLTKCRAWAATWDVIIALPNE